jgi:hypothetical protein
LLLRAARAPQAGTSREVLDRLAELGQERFPALADLAREVRYRSFDQPALDRVRDEQYAQAERDLMLLAVASEVERDGISERLVECPQPLATLLLSRMAKAESALLRPRLLTTLLRRYYRFRSLELATAVDVEGLPCAWVDYELGGQRFRLVACSAEVRLIAVRCSPPRCGRGARSSSSCTSGRKARPARRTRSRRRCERH